MYNNKKQILIKSKFKFEFSQAKYIFYMRQEKNVIQKCSVLVAQKYLVRLSKFLSYSIVEVYRVLIEIPAVNVIAQKEL